MCTSGKILLENHNYVYYLLSMHKGSVFYSVKQFDIEMSPYIYVYIYIYKSSESKNGVFSNQSVCVSISNFSQLYIEIDKVCSSQTLYTALDNVQCRTTTSRAPLT